MQSAKKSILVVEDETVVRELIRRILSEAGYDVALAADVKSAMESIRGRRPDMILLDIVLPGKSGFDPKDVKARVAFQFLKAERNKTA